LGGKPPKTLSPPPPKRGKGGEKGAQNHPKGNFTPPPPPQKGKRFKIIKILLGKGKFWGKG